MTTDHPLRLGIIGSSGGSALAAASHCLANAGKKIQWVVITDRPCGIEDWAKVNGHEVHRLDYLNAENFSERAYAFFCSTGCEDVLLFYTRRVASPLIDRLRVWNLHPSLLPAFRGLHGVQDAITAGVRIFGATLHRVDAGLDTGQIVAQVCSPLPEHLSLVEAEHVSYLQKVWLSLVWFEQLTAPHGKQEAYRYDPAVVAACPGLADESLRASYAEWLVREEGSKVKRR